ncbi:MAG: DUF6242 domain-containing protein [Dysgonomonas sp.]
MKRILYILLLCTLFVSCSSDDDKEEDTFLSKDAQIYSFKLIGENSEEQSILNNIHFSIDQFNKIIYYPNIIPINNRKYNIVMTFSKDAPSNVLIIYPNDSIVKWEYPKLIDLSLNPQIKVIAQDPTSERIYTISIKW